VDQTSSACTVDAGQGRLLVGWHLIQEETSMPDTSQKDTFGSLGGEPVNLKELANYLGAQLEKVVRERPLASVAVALAAGYLLASLKRR
jgi:hypothetical protein